MSWGLIFAGISAGSGLFNMIDEHRANRVIRRDLEQIKRYLESLTAAVETIRVQNQAILERIDTLPSKIRNIVQEVVDVALLRERYTSIDARYAQYLAFDTLNGYGLRDQEWVQFWDALYYLFRHENRLSRTFDLLRACEIALVITKERSLPLVRTLLQDRITVMEALREATEARIEYRLGALQNALDVRLYVASHNLDRDLQSLDHLVFVPAADRTVIEHYTVRVCKPSRRSRYDDSIDICRDEPRQREVDDVAFRRARDGHVVDIQAKLADLRPMLPELSAMVRCIGILRDYLAAMQQMALVDVSAEVLPMYFFDVARDTMETQALDGLSEVDDADLRDYFDSSCDGACKDKRGLREQTESRLFARDPIC